MPNYKNWFDKPTYYDHKIMDSNGVVGTIRIKPSGVLWKGLSQQNFSRVSLEKFIEWISQNGEESAS